MTRLIAPVLLAVVLMVSHVNASLADAGCTAATLEGRWAYYRVGSVIETPSPIGGVGIATYDPLGKVTVLDIVNSSKASTAGIPDWAHVMPRIMQFEVNLDCTFRLFTTRLGSVGAGKTGPVQVNVAYGVIAVARNELYLLSADPKQVVVSVAKRIDN